MGSGQPSILHQRPALPSARRLTSPAAFWASWADCLHTVMTTALADNSPGHHLQAAVACKERLLDVGFGFETPPWADLQRGAQPKQNELDDPEPAVWPFGLPRKSKRRNVATFESVVALPRWSNRRTAFYVRAKGVALSFRCSPVPSPPVAASLAATRFSWRPPCSMRPSGVLGRRGFALDSAAARICRGVRECPDPMDLPT